MAKKPTSTPSLIESLGLPQDLSSLVATATVRELIEEGQHAITYTSAKIVQPKEQDKNYSHDHNQIELGAETDDGKKVVDYVSTTGFAGFSEKELAPWISALEQDSSFDALILQHPKVNKTPTAWSKMSVAQKMNAIFEEGAIDPRDPGKGSYAVMRWNGKRVVDPAKTEKALSIIGAIAVNAGVIEKGQSVTVAQFMAEIVGKSVGAEFEHRQGNKGTYAKLVRTFPVSELE